MMRKVKVHVLRYVKYCGRQETRGRNTPRGVPSLFLTPTFAARAFPAI
jgi:hypothetical protein